MRIEINIEKRHFFVLMGTILLLAGVVFVVGYNPTGQGGDPAVMGHSVDEMDWSNPILSDVAIKEPTPSLKLETTSGLQNAYRVGLSGSSFYISEVGDGFTDSIFLTTSGRVGIGDATPSEKLGVNGNIDANGISLSNNVIANGNVQANGDLCIDTVCKNNWGQPVYSCPATTGKCVGQLSLMPTCHNAYSNVACTPAGTLVPN